MRNILSILLIAFLSSCSSCPKDKPIYRVVKTTYYYTETGVSSPIKGKLYKGDKISVIKTTNNPHWWLICREGEYGFVLNKNLDFIDSDVENLKLLDSVQNPSSFNFFLLYIFLFGFLSFLLAYFIGRHRKIGFWFSLILGILITPFISWLPIISSRKKDENKELKKSRKLISKVLGVGLIIISLFGILFNTNTTKDNLISYFLAIGFISYGIYLLKNK